MAAAALDASRAKNYAAAAAALAPLSSVERACFFIDNHYFDTFPDAVDAMWKAYPHEKCASLVIEALRTEDYDLAAVVLADIADPSLASALLYAYLPRLVSVVASRPALSRLL